MTFKDEFKFDRKRYNLTLKYIFNEYEREMWSYHRQNKSDRSSIGKFIVKPSVTTLKKWFKYWNDKIVFKDIDIEYINMIIDKKERL